MNLKMSTPLVSLHQFPFMDLTASMSRKLASAVAGYALKTEITEATIADLLGYYPMRYEDRSRFQTIDQLTPDVEASVELFVRVSGGYRVGRNRSPKAPPLFIFEINAADEANRSRPVVVWWFISGRSAPQIVQYYQKRFARGTRLVAFGKWEWDSRRGTFALRINKPDDLEILPQVVESANEPSFDRSDLEDDQENPRFAMVHVGRAVPVYRKLGEFRTKRLREVIHCVLANLDENSVEDQLPEATLRRLDLLRLPVAIKAIHFPPESEMLSDYSRFRSPAQRRLIFEEFFWLSLAIAVRRSERLVESRPGIDLSSELLKKMASIAPFDLTGAQKQVTRTIIDDMSSDHPMNRLVQGDVGSGKTIVAFMAMYAAMENGFQTALMAPTEILADQHARNAAKIFGKTGHRVALLTGSLKAAEKRAVRDAIAAGEVDAVVGTHAIIQDGVEFRNLGLAVIDEQHRFGVLQRAEIRDRGLNPDVLVMTATPIPRSLAMTLYGDLDVSVIDELPPGRTPIKTVVVGEDQRSGVYRGIERELKKGRQVYVVYPLVEESEKSDLKAATAMFKELRDKVFPSFSVGLLHGKMKAAEKEEVMRDFVARKIGILVSTTVIEVGVDVPNASLMIIEHAERFGLSQLHQLRGRVGRGADESFCVLISDDSKTSAAKERLGVMEETNDGFLIAEKDLEIRGEGDLLGTRQAGLRSFRIASLWRDVSVLQEARNEARGYVEANDDLAEFERLLKVVSADPRFRLGAIG